MKNSVEVAALSSVSGRGLVVQADSSALKDLFTDLGPTRLEIGLRATVD